MEDIIKFLHEIEKLKKIKRTGWVIREVSEPESVADYSFRTALMALILAEKAGVDKGKAVKLALVHDIAEISAGDITPHDKITLEQKHKLEHEAMKKLLKNIDSQEILELWEEYEEKKTPEAQFVFELDKVEMVLQAFEYEKAGQKKNLNEFFPYADKRVKGKVAREILELIREKRK